MANTIKIKRGLSTDLNNASLQQGELAMTTDTYNLYVGVGSGDYIKIGGGPKNISDGKAKYSVRTINSASESDAYKLGECAFAEGKHTKASGEGSHAEGMDTTASGNYSHAEGLNAQALGFGSHVEGFQTTASKSYSHAEGDGTTASGDTSHAEGGYTTASGLYSHAEGYHTTASGARSHAEGKGTTASGENQQVQGKYNIEDEINAHIIGNGATDDARSNAHTVAWDGTAWYQGDVYVGSTSGKNKDEGSVKLAKITEVPTKTSQLTNDSQFVTSTDILSNLVDGKAKGSIRSIDAYDETGKLLGQYAQAFGKSTIASGNTSHAEGHVTTASGQFSHAEGYTTIASDHASHAEGSDTTASGYASHAEGYGTIASRDHQHVQGKYNIEDTTSAYIVGNGLSDSSRSNAHTLDWKGNAWFAGDVYVKSTGRKNKDSGSKKLATEEYVNNLVGSSDTLPIGSMLPYGNVNPPTGWLVCDGSAVSRTVYAELFKVIGISYGAGDGSATFNLPNKKGRGSMGFDSADADFNTIGKTGGEKKHTLTTEEMPNHKHTVYNVNSGGPIEVTQGYGLTFEQDAPFKTWGAYANMNTTGGDQPHNNLQPYEVDCWIIKAFQSAGVVANVAQTKTTSSTDVYSCNYINEKLKSEPKITVWTSSTPMITADNEEIRCMGSDGTVSSLLLSFLDTLIFTNSTKFSSSIVFKTSSSNCSFAVTPPTSVSLKMAGDDVTDGNFSPQSNKVYDIVFYWNGFYLNGIVKGTEVKTQDGPTNNRG